MHSSNKNVPKPKCVIARSCPVCGAEMVALRSSSRCVRCQWIACDTCEGWNDQEEPSSEDPQGSFL
jgi:hypothetical protein